jgi:amidase
VGRTAAQLAAEVQAGRVRPVDVIRAHLDHIAALDQRVAVFQLVRQDRSLAEAECWVLGWTWPTFPWPGCQWP